VQPPSLVATQLDQPSQRAGRSSRWPPAWSWWRSPKASKANRRNRLDLDAMSDRSHRKRRRGVPDRNAWRRIRPGL